MYMYVFIYISKHTNILDMHVPMYINKVGSYKKNKRKRKNQQQQHEFT